MIPTALLLAACTNSIDHRDLAPASPSGITVVGVPDNPDDIFGLISDRVFFDTDSSNLTPIAQAVLQKQAGWLRAFPKHTVTIEGHADERGTREYNLALGERRARAVMDYLTALGIEAQRLKTISYGKERPLCTEPEESCWSRNRRGVTTLDP